MPLIEERVSLSVKKILLATDFSLASEKASAYAKALARRFSSTVEIAHVFDPSVVTSYEEAVIGQPATVRLSTTRDRLELLEAEFTSAGDQGRNRSPRRTSTLRSAIKDRKNKKSRPAHSGDGVEIWRRETRSRFNGGGADSERGDSRLDGRTKRHPPKRWAVSLQEYYLRHRFFERIGPGGDVCSFVCPG